MPTWEIRQGDALEVLRTMPDEAVHCVVTSPPYWGLRDYEVDGQIGLEATLEDYVWKLLEVFREVWRVLRPDGTVWLNMGDGYVTRPRGNDKGWDKSRLTNPGRVQKAQVASLMNGRDFGALKPKDLIGIPWVLAFALRADGWWLRNDNIWNKTNPMPESVGDRCSRSHEYMFHLSKSSRYYYDAVGIREPDKGLDHARSEAREIDRRQPDAPPHRGLRTLTGRNGRGRNKRSVWTVSTVPYAAAHFAAFPPKLIEPCILAGTAPATCSDCGSPRKRIVSSERPPGDWNPTGKTNPHDVHRMVVNGDDFYEKIPAPKTLGWEPTCDHVATEVPSVVLDPFAGSGTTGLVALRHGRSFVGVELNPEYVDLARTRIVDDAPLLNQGSEVAA